MFFGEFIEIFGKHTDGQFNTFRFVLFSFQLKQQTFLQIPGSNTGRIKLLDAGNDGFDFLICTFNILAESQIIYNGSRFPAQITIVINAAYNLFCNLAVRSSSFSIPS